MSVFRITLFFLILLSFQASAQSDKSEKRSTSTNKGFSIELPRLNNIELRSNSSTKGGAYEFATRRDVDLTPFNSGKWTKKETYWEWTVEIHSPGALSLNLGFTEYELPESSSLTIENEKGKKIGPFTKSDNKDHSQLWTPNLDGDKIYVKLQVPEQHLKEIQLKLSAVNHGFRRPELRSSGNCNIDVACGEDGSFPIINQFQDQIRSVAAVQISGILFCSGYLINNTQNDFEPYFVTAAHCNITAQTEATTIFFWNYQNSECRPPNSVESGEDGDGTLDQFTLGSTVVASAINGDLDPTSVDYTLVLLDEPVNPDFRPYFNGWDIRPVLPDSTIVIHHPNVEEKRISFDFDPPQFEAFDGDDVYVRVLNYELGTTEGGSSGSPLFNPQGRVIGSLSGGNASCSFPEGFDRFGWLGRAWVNGGSAQTRMRDWLDPNNSGIQEMDGLDGAFSIRIENAFQVVCGFRNPSIEKEIIIDPNFNGTVQLSVSGQPEEVFISFQEDQVQPGESTILTLENIDLLESGNYQVSILGTDGVNSSSNILTLEVIENIPAALTTISPSQNETFLEGQSFFMWNGQEGEYEIEIAEHIDFSSPIVQESNIPNNRFSTNDLNENAEYFWRVRSSNLCGASMWSNPIKFRTANFNCTAYMENNLGIEIDDGRGDIVEAEIEVDISQPIASVNVPLVAGTHSWSSDLTFNLISPEGTQIILGDELCDAMQFMDFNIGFNDFGLPLSSIPCPFIDGLDYQPEDQLSSFSGENPSGTWTLRIVDNFNLDGGFLQDFHLEICSASDRQLFSQFDDDTFNGCGENSLTSSFQLSNDFDGPVQISAASPNSNLNIQLEQTTANPGDVISYTINGVDQLQEVTNSVRFFFNDGQFNSESAIVINFESDIAEFDLVQPANNSFIRADDSFDFEWEDLANNAGYTIQFSVDDPLFTETIDVSSDTNTSNVAVVSDLFSEENGPETIYWRVVANFDNCDPISETFSFILDLTSAVTQIDGTTISILPNPFQSEIEIDFSKTLNSDATIDLFDLSGRQIQTTRVNKGENQLSINTIDVPSGIYFLRLASDDILIVEKLVKQ